MTFKQFTLDALKRAAKNLHVPLIIVPPPQGQSAAAWVMRVDPMVCLAAGGEWVGIVAEG